MIHTPISLLSSKAPLKEAHKPSDWLQAALRDASSDKRVPNMGQCVNVVVSVSRRSSRKPGCRIGMPERRTQDAGAAIRRVLRRVCEIVCYTVALSDFN